jgi:type III restriction enzyme
MKLFGFQESAIRELIDKAVSFHDPARDDEWSDREPRNAPFVQILQAVTGAGKTPIATSFLAEWAKLRTRPLLVIWTSKTDSVTSQALTNLSPGGSYASLLPGFQTMGLDELAGNPSVLEPDAGNLLFSGTTAMFNVEARDGRRLHSERTFVDASGTGTSIWGRIAQLGDPKTGSHEVVVVYDEGQNNTDAQADLLLDLKPAVFLLVSATPESALTNKMRARAGIESVEQLNAFRDRFVTFVETARVVDANLIKATIELRNDLREPKVVIGAMVEEQWRRAEAAKAEGATFTPKAVYVCDTNIVGDDQRPFASRQARPIVIWRDLVAAGVAPDSIAIYAELKLGADHPDNCHLPADFNELRAGNYEHIIFNKRLEEGWDDPAVSLAYIDKWTESTRLITQLIGRVIRQPEPERRFVEESLRTATIYVSIPNDKVKGVVENLRSEIGSTFLDRDRQWLRVFEDQAGSPVEVAITSGREQHIPRFALKPADGTIDAMTTVLSTTPEFLDLERAVETDETTVIVDVAKGSVREDVRQGTGRERERPVLELILEHLRSVCPDARDAFDQDRDLVGRLPAKTRERLRARIARSSPAYQEARKLAEGMARAYLERVYFTERSFGSWAVGVTRLRSESGSTAYVNSIHARYDGMNPGELACAAALDELGFPWMRNPAGRDGYSIDLPVYGSGSQRFFPDFLLFAGTRILAIDPKGGQLLNDAIRDKLLAPLRTNDGRTIEILLVSSGTWAVETDGGVRQTSRTEGVTSFTRDRLTLTAQPHQGWEAWAQSLAVG